MRDLFGNDTELNLLPLPGAEVLYARRFFTSRAPEELLNEFISSVPWQQEKVTVWGKEHLQPRLVSWYGDLGAAYTYSGLRLTPLPWTTVLLEIKRAVELAADTDFNSVLLNYYRDHRDSMGYHSDDEPELGAQPTIASLSFGAERTLILKPKIEGAAKPTKLNLASGSLLLMRGETQKNWKHGISKESKPCGPRVNLTFRKIFFKS